MQTTIGELVGKGPDHGYARERREAGRKGWPLYVRPCLAAGMRNRAGAERAR